MTKPILYILRRDLRLGDHPGLSAAAETGRPVIPVFIDDEVLRSQGAAPRWRLGLGVAEFSDALTGVGSMLILRRGEALIEIKSLIRDTGADTVFWSRAYDPPSVARDKSVKAALEADGIEARSHAGHLLFEPWSVETGQGGPYRVYSPFWKTVRGARCEQSGGDGHAAGGARSLAREPDLRRPENGCRNAARRVSRRGLRVRG